MGRSAEAKVWEVVVGQIWDCFPGFCELTRDLKEVRPLPQRGVELTCRA
jgi:ribosomal RNA-processing protein 12